MTRQMIAILIVVLRGKDKISKIQIKFINLIFKFDNFRSLDSEEHPETGEPEVKKAKSSE